MEWQAARLLMLTLVGLLTVATAAVAAEFPAPKPIPEPRCRHLDLGEPGPRGDQLLIDHSMDVYLSREGPDIVILNRNSGRLSPISCEGGSATVDSIDRIVYRPVKGAHQLNIDGSGGRFAPGAAPEPGADEIEIAIDFPPTKPHRLSSIRILATPGGDAIGIGAIRGERTGVDLDADGHRPHADADVIVSASSPTKFQIVGGEGDDTISSAGVGGLFIGPLPARNLVLRGGGGADLLLGGLRRELMDGGAGDDVLYGRGGADSLTGGEGGDRGFGGPGDDRLATGGGGAFDYLSGGSGKDAIGALDGDGDRVRCGDGVDNVWLDPVDAWRDAGCEKLHGPGFPDPRG